MKKLLSTIVEAMQNKKAKSISIVDMSALDSPCQYFVICQGNSTTQVMSIGIEVKDYVRDTLHEKPFASDGYENCQWIAIDYGPVIVHVFQPEVRAFYDIEHLWADAKITNIPDID